jgi:hypothetical protein
VTSTAPTRVAPWQPPVIGRMHDWRFCFAGAALQSGLPLTCPLRCPGPLTVVANVTVRSIIEQQQRRRQLAAAAPLARQGSQRDGHTHSSHTCAPVLHLSWECGTCFNDPPPPKDGFALQGQKKASSTHATSPSRPRVLQAPFFGAFEVNWV